jgi:UDP-N-acetylmuramate dehydrogenase
MRLAELTTLRVGGEARRILTPATRDELVGAVRDAWAADDHDDHDDHVLLLGGGSNVLISDDDFDGTVIRVVTRGITRLPAGDATRVRLRVEAGEPWDDLVAYTVARGWAGLEALSGIPGSCGAAPIQNIGAYGQDLAACLVAIDFLDSLTGKVERIATSDLRLGYRTSTLKRGPNQGRDGLVVSLELDLVPDVAALSQPVAYAQLAAALGVPIGARVALAELRRTVLGLRASKGMLLDPHDPDSVSAGSFFTNPIVDENFARHLPADAPRWPVGPEASSVILPLGEGVPTLPVPVSSVAVSCAREAYRVKLSAAWLIEHSGVGRGFSLPGSRAAVSGKHTLALTNRGGAAASDISELARFIQTRVLAEFGVRLHPEPVFVGIEL